MPMGVTFHITLRQLKKSRYLPTPSKQAHFSSALALAQDVGARLQIGWVKADQGWKPRL